MALKEVEKILKRYCQKRQGILLAYIFGSTVKYPEKARDLDIAFLLDDKELMGDYLKVKTEIQFELAALLGRGDVDIVILNDASLLLRHEVLKNGSLLFEKDIEIRCNFEVESEIKFFDFEPVRRLFWESLAQRIRQEKLGD